MVLWEITLATAYWLGLRKTYKIALRLQRRLIGPQHPRIREFVQRRTRNVFDVALTVHKEIQKRDLSAGKSIGNYILRFFDRARPSANIRGGPSQNQKTNGQKLFPTNHSTRVESSMPRQITSKPSVKSHDRFLFNHYHKEAPFGQAFRNRLSVGVSKMYPSIHKTRSALAVRSFSDDVLTWHTPSPRPLLALPMYRGVFRDDIAQWMLRRQVSEGTVN